MINLVKMDWFRMMKMKSTWILWIVMSAMLIFSTLVMSKRFSDPVPVEQTQQDINETVQSENRGDVGIVVRIPTEPGERATVYDLFFANVQGKAIALFLVIFAVLFSTGDIRSGYIKNVGGQVENRMKMIWSKAIVLFSFTFLTFLIALFVQAIANFISFQYLEWGNLRELGVYFVLEIILNYAFGLIIMGIAIVISNNVISMALAVMLCMNLMFIIYGELNSLIENVTGKAVNVIPYTVTGQISMIQMHLSGSETERAAIVAVCYVVLAVCISSLVFKKRDIR